MFEKRKSLLLRGSSNLQRLWDGVSGLVGSGVFGDFSLLVEVRRLCLRLLSRSMLPFTSPSHTAFSKRTSNWRWQGFSSFGCLVKGTGVY